MHPREPLRWKRLSYPEEEHGEKTPQRKYCLVLHCTPTLRQRIRSLPILIRRNVSTVEHAVKTVRQMQ